GAPVPPLPAEGAPLIPLVDAEARAHEIDEGMKAHRAAEGQAMTFLPRRDAFDAPAKLQQQARLPDSRVADQKHRLALAGAGPLEGVEEERQPALAPHEGREPSLGLDPEPRARLVRA